MEIMEFCRKLPRVYAIRPVAGNKFHQAFNDDTFSVFRQSKMLATLQLLDQ